MGAIEFGLPWWGGGVYDIGGDPSPYVVADGFGFLQVHYRGGPVADMGCWTGRHIPVLDRLGGTVEGIDRLLAGEMLAQAAQAHRGVRFRNYHLQDMRALEDGYYGAALIWRVLHNMRISVLTSAVSEIARVLRAGAPVVVAVRAEKAEVQGSRPMSRITGGEGKEREDLYFTRASIDTVLGGLFTIAHTELITEGEWVDDHYRENVYWVAHLIRR